MRLPATLTSASAFTFTVAVACAHADRWAGYGAFTAGAAVPAADVPDNTGGGELTAAGSFLGFGIYASLEWRTGERLLDDGDAQRRHGFGAGGGVRFSPLGVLYASDSYDGPAPPVDLFAIAGGAVGWELDAGGFYGGGILGAGLDLRWPARHAPTIGVRFHRGHGGDDHLLGDTVLLVAGLVEQDRCGAGGLLPTHH